MKDKIIIRGGQVIDPVRGSIAFEDLLVESRAGCASGKVTIGKPGAFEDLKGVADVVEAAGQFVTPGLVDLHVHLREPGQEWKENIKTGSEAAVLGGITTVCCMPNTQPRNDCEEITRAILEKATIADAARVLPIGAVTIGLKGKELSPLSELFNAGCCAFSDDGEPVYDAGIMRRALEWCAMHGATIMCHEEDKSLSAGGVMNESPLSFRLGLPGMAKVAEDVMIARDIELARVTKGKVHICHVSTARSVELIRRAKNDGISITAEVTPHHLLLTEECVCGFDTNSKMSPPLREAEDCEALLLGLKDGTIDCIASDHAPHELDSKRCEFERASFGILGLQTNLPLLLQLIKEHGLPMLRGIQSFTSSAGAILGTNSGSNHNLGTFNVADIVVIDPDAVWEMNESSIHSKSKNTPFLNQQLRGKASTVIVGGKIKVRDGKLEAR